MDTMQEQIIELQTRLAFQEDILNQLNGVVTEQAGRIDQLQQQLRMLADKYEDLRHNSAAGANLGQEPPPPHY